MKPRLLMVLSAAHGEEAKQMLKAIHSARTRAQEFIIHAEFFDPVFESPFRFSHFPERIEKIKKGHFKAILVMGSASSKQVVDLLEAIPEDTEVGNFAAPGSALDYVTIHVTCSPNRMWKLEAQEQS